MPKNTIAPRRSVAALVPSGHDSALAIVRRASDDASARFAPASYSAKAHTVEAVLSAGRRIPRWGGFEELAISPDAIDLSRVALGQVLFLNSHNQFDIGAVLGTVESVRIESGKLIGRIRFAETAAGRVAEGMVARGEIAGISVGYRVTEWSLLSNHDETEIWRAEKWELLEASLVSVPADTQALIRSTRGSSSMPRRNPSNQTTEQDDADITLTRDGAANDAPLAPTASAPRREMSDRDQLAAIEIGERAGFDLTTTRDLMGRASSLDGFRELVFDRMAHNAARLETRAISAQGSTLDNPAFLSRTIEDVIFSRITGQAPQGAAREMAGHTVPDLCRVYLEGRGERGASRMSREQVVTRAMHSTDDFPLLLVGAGNRSLEHFYRVSESPIKRIARRRDLADFRPHDLIKISLAPELQQVGQGGEIKYGTMDEAKEVIAAQTYGVMFALTRQAMINDQLGAFSDLLLQQGKAAARKEGDLLAAVLTANSGNGVTLVDSNPLYHTAHANKAASGTVIDTANLSAARMALRDQKDLDGKTKLGIAPKFIVVSSAKETEAEVAVAAIAPAQTSAVNPFSGKLEVVVVPQLSGNAWRLFADPANAPVLIYGVLEGREGPRVEAKEGWSILGTEFRVYMDYAAGVCDYRGTYLNAGA